MCGIGGIFLKNRSGINLKETVFKLSQTIKHRGPDGEGFVFISESSATPLASEDTPQFQNKDLNYIPKQTLNSFNTEANLALAHRRLSILDLTDTGHQPMASRDADIWITYNGEVYNYIELRKELEYLGHKFISTTDTEVIINAYQNGGPIACRNSTACGLFACTIRISRSYFVREIDSV
jgi:asparagine synthase (glutamine-hydrolysing)